MSQTGHVHKSLPFPGEPASQLTLARPGAWAFGSEPRPQGSCVEASRLSFSVSVDSTLPNTLLPTL